VLREVRDKTLSQSFNADMFTTLLWKLCVNLGPISRVVYAE